MKNILHLSDFHTSESVIQGMNDKRLELLLGELIEDLALLPTPDTIFITGDIAYSGRAEEYKIFEDIFLMPLLRHLNIGYDRVLTTPGNHDSNRKAWSKSDELVKDSLVSRPENELIEAVLRENIAPDKCAWMSNYEDLSKKLNSAENKKQLLSNKLFSAYAIDGVGIGCLNTAWLAFPPDREKLFIGEWQISSVLKALKPFKQKILLQHHPLDWLHPEDRSVITDYVHTSGIKALFYGHMHSIRMMKESLFSEDSVLKLQAGKMDTIKRDGYAGYTLISLLDNNDFDGGELHFRKFNPNRDKFEPWKERVSNGILSYSLGNSIPFNSSEFSDLCYTKAEFLEYDLLCNVGLPADQQKRLCDIFIFPSLKLDNQTPTESDLGAGGPQKKPTGTTIQTISKSSKRVTFDDIICSDESMIITGGENTGKSTLAKRIAISYLREQASCNFSNLIFYVDCKSRNFDKERKLRDGLFSFYTDGVDSSSFDAKLEKSLGGSNSIIIIDSIEALDSRSLNVVFEYIATHSSARYIICGQLSVQQLLVELVTKISDKKIFKRYTVKALKRSHVRELFSKWANSANKKGNFVNSALRTVSGAGMPNNPFVYTMLLSIRDRKATTFRSFMHEADLVENFIEIIMQKHVFSAENAPQYKDVLLFLGFAAEKMHENGDYCISEANITKAVVEFNDKISQDFSFRGYIDPIVTSGIMRLEKGCYRFSQLCFLNYVYANWICKNSIPYEQLDCQLDFLRFDKVIEYVAAIKKSDLSLLDYISQKVSEAWNNVLLHEGIADLGNFELEMTNAVSHDILDLLKDDELESPLIDRPATQEEVDDALDKSAPLSDSAVCDVKTHRDKVPSTVAFNETLSLYARVFRAAEHILGADATMRHFKNIFDYYVRFIAYSVRVFDKRLRPVALQYILRAIDYDSMSDAQKGEAHAQINAFINFTIAAVPNLTVSMMSSDFFNQRQKPRIEKHREVVDENLAKILLTYCLCELDGVDVVGELKRLDYLRPFESSSLLLKIFELILFNFNITNEEKKELDKFIRKTLADRKTHKLFTNLTAISSKVYGHAAQDAGAKNVLTAVQ